jgi:hypothetical protein
MQIDAAGENVKTQIEAATSNVTSQIDEQRQIEKRRRVHDHLRTFYSAAFTEMSADAGLVFLAARRDPSEIERALLVDLYWRKYRDSRSGSQRAPPSLISPVHIQT